MRRINKAEINFKKLAFLFIMQAMIFFTGCVSVNQLPFAEFRDSIKEAGEGMDSTMSLCYNSTKTAFCDEFANKKDSKFSELMLMTGEGAKWEWKKKPLFLSVKDAQQALGDLNNILYAYSSLLFEVASGSVKDNEKFDLMVADLNNNINNTLKALDISSPDGAAIFSVATVELLNLYIKERRVETLQEAIAKNKQNIKSYSMLCLNLIRTVRANLKSSYSTRIENASNSWNDAAPEKRRELTENIVQIDEEFIQVSNNLRKMEDFYVLLPEAHDDLVIAAGGNMIDIKNLKSLCCEAKRLNSQYKKLKKVNSEL